ncbi:MAG: trypsin-like peptidase domain-containing protein [Bacteroidota bacterium]
MHRTFWAFFLLCSSATVLVAQSMDRNTLQRVKEASVFVQVTHSFPLTGDEFSGSGSGFFVSESGHVITNYHVVQAQVSAYGITFPTPLKGVEIIRNPGHSNFEKYPGQILAVDKAHDLALIGIDLGGDSVPHLDILPSDSLYELIPVWAFGFPFGDEFSVLDRGPEVSVTQGHVTALRHDDRAVLDKVQIDAVVNTGNSGGPAVNQRGEVMGVVNMRYGDSRVNFAVPGHFAQNLIQSVALDAPVNVTSKVQITSPEGSRVFVDWKPVAASPEGISVPHGQHTICVMQEGSDAYLGEYFVLGPQSLDIRLPQTRDMVINPVPADSGAPIAPDALNALLDPVRAQPPMYAEDFSERDHLPQWRQSTGGAEQRTWYVAEGKLHQHVGNSDLHAIFLGEKHWADYHVQARLRIQDEDNDGRAGIIFRENEAGFYLLRLHRETDKVQLLYHSKGPFGWFVLQEKQLTQDIDDEWHELGIHVAGNRTVGFLDGVPVIDLQSDFSPGGRVGFYAVETQAEFDDLQVTPVDAPATVAQGSPAGVRSFWFSDEFSLESTWWYHYNAETGAPSPWAFSEGGCAIAFDDESERICEFTRYQMADFRLNLNISMGEAVQGSHFGVVFRKVGDQYLKLELDHDADEIRLVFVNGKRKKVLKKEELGSEFFDNSSLLRLQVEGDRVLCESYELPLLEYEDKDLLQAPGRLALSATQVRLVLHRMTVSSVNQDFGKEK